MSRTRIEPPVLETPIAGNTTKRRPSQLGLPAEPPDVRKTRAPQDTSASIDVDDIAAMRGRMWDGGEASRIIATFCSSMRLERGLVTCLAYGVAGKPKLLFYDLERLVQHGALSTLFVKGTVLTMDTGVLQTLLCNLVFAACLAVFAVLTDGGGGGGAAGDAAEVRDFGSGLTKLSSYLNGFVPFVLGMYLSLAIARWWKLRIAALGKVFDAVANTMVIVGKCCIQERFHPVRDQALRYSLVSILLLLKAARRKEEITDLIEKDLLRPSEAEILKSLAPFQRCMAIWTWVVIACDKAFTKAKRPIGNALMVAKTATKARDGIQTIHTYLHSQLPYAYVQLVSALVNISNTIFSMKCGYVFGQALLRNDVNAMGVQVFMILLAPTSYAALLAITYTIEDPFGEDMLDFPIAAYTEYVAQCCESALLASVKYPGMLLPDGSFQATETLEKLSAEKNQEKKRMEMERKRWLMEYSSLPHSKFVHLAIADACQSYSSQVHALHLQLQAMTEWLPAQPAPPPRYSISKLKNWEKNFHVGNDEDVVSNSEISLEDGDDADSD